MFLKKTYRWPQSLAAGMLLLTVCTPTAAVPVTAREQSIVLGLQDGWRDVQHTTNVVFAPGKRGFPDIVLQDAEYTVQEDTDLLIHFNESVPLDAAGHYRTLEADVRPSQQLSKIGGAGGLFNGDGSGLVLSPGPESMFATGNSWSDFSIEFWLWSASLTDGETVLLWRSARTLAETPMLQEIRVDVTRRRLRWVFDNLFLPPDAGPTVIELAGRTRLLPKQWDHHLLTFDAETGLLEYQVNGSPEAITYATTTRAEGGDAYIPYTGNAASGAVMVGHTLNGLLDEMRITRSLVAEPTIDKYRLHTGTAATRVFDLGFSGSTVLSIDSDFALPGNTDVYYFYRLSNKLETRSTVAAPWTPFVPGTAFDETAVGRYLQLMVELLPDGTGRHSPSISTIEILYAQDLPPHPPAWLVAKASDRSITLEWQKPNDDDVAGYLLYYGERPHQYFGTGSSLGPSPIDVGLTTTTTLDDLENGKLYYFAVAPYDRADPPHLGEFSVEEAARPSIIYRDE